jgi:hypothetical protein
MKFRVPMIYTECRHHAVSCHYSGDVSNYWTGGNNLPNEWS